MHSCNNITVHKLQFAKCNPKDCNLNHSNSSFSHFDIFIWLYTAVNNPLFQHQDEQITDKTELKSTGKRARARSVEQSETNRWTNKKHANTSNYHLHLTDTLIQYRLTNDKKKTLISISRYIITKCWIQSFVSLFSFNQCRFSFVTDWL